VEHDSKGLSRRGREGNGLMLAGGRWGRPVGAFLIAIDPAAFAVELPAAPSYRSRERNLK